MNSDIQLMLDDTIRENVVFGHAKDTHTDDAVRAALEETQLADFVKELPQGLDTKIKERGGASVRRAAYRNCKSTVHKSGSAGI